MKRIREKLYENFKENSDPIQDMGIGACYNKVRQLREKLQDLWDENYELVLNDEDRGQSLDIIEQIQTLVDEILREQK